MILPTEKTLWRRCEALEYRVFLESGYVEESPAERIADFDRYGNALSTKIARFSDAGGAAMLDYKLKSFSHAGMPHNDAMVAGIADGTWVEKPEQQLKIVPIDASYPKFVFENIEKIKKWGLVYQHA